MKVLLLLFFVATAGIVSGQDGTRVTIKAETKIMEAMSALDIFYYPAFTQGKVYFRYGTITDAKLNYNKVVDEMHFIAPKGDTMAVTDEKTIKYIVVRNDTFFYDQGYVRLISGGKGLQLAIKQTWRISDTRKIGAFNTANSHSAITSYINYSDPTRLYDLVVNEDIVLANVKEYYLGDNNGRFFPASKRSLLNLLPKEEKRLEVYLKENKIDFNKQADLEKIMQLVN